MFSRDAILESDGQLIDSHWFTTLGSRVPTETDRHSRIVLATTLRSPTAYIWMLFVDLF